MVLTGLAGALMSLAGLGLIELSKDLILYTGVVLLVLTVLFYLTDGDQPKKQVSGGEN